jgi:hypothetical protein
MRPIIETQASTTWQIAQYSSMAVIKAAKGTKYCD